MSALEQPALPGTRTVAPSRKARLFKTGARWTVNVPTPFGAHVHRVRSFAAAIRYLDLVTRRRRRHA